MNGFGIRAHWFALAVALSSLAARASPPLLDGAVIYSDMDKDSTGKKITDPDDRKAASMWIKQYVAKRPTLRSGVLQGIKANHAQITKAVEAAASAAETAVKKHKADGFVAFFISHGGASSSTSRTDSAEGLIELNGWGSVSLVGRNSDLSKKDPGAIEIFHANQHKQKGPKEMIKPSEEEGLKFYLGLGKVLKAHHIDTVVFLACDAGRGQDFLQKIADDWDVLVVMPKTKLAVQVRAKKRVRAYILGDHDGEGSNVPLAEENIVFGKFTEHWGHAFPTAWDASRKHLPPGFEDGASVGPHGGSTSILPTPDCSSTNLECRQAVGLYCKMNPSPHCGQSSNGPGEHNGPEHKPVEHQLPNQKMPAVKPKPPVVVRKDIKSSCNLSEDRSTMYFWSYNPRKEPGRYSLRCQNGFKDEMKVTAPEYAQDGDPQPGHYRADGWFYHGSVTSGPGLAATACSTEFVGTNVRGGSPYATCAGLDQPKPATFRECAVAGAASKLGQDLTGSFGTARYSGMFAVRVWNECGKGSVTWQAAVHGQSPVMSGSGTASGDIIAWTPEGSGEHLFAIVESVSGDQLTVIQGAQAGGQVARETVSARQVWHYTAD